MVRKVTCGVCGGEAKSLGPFGELLWFECFQCAEKFCQYQGSSKPHSAPSAPTAAEEVEEDQES